MSTTSAHRLAEIGRSARTRLDGHPQVQMVAGIGIDLYVYQDFLDARECAALIAMIDADREPSKLLSTTADHQVFRTSESCNMNRFDPLVEAIDQRLCALLAMRPAQGETLQGQRYGVGQLFMAHHDWFHENEDYWPALRAKGGQRSWTAMIYLDEPEGGGETWFSAAGLKVSPRTAMLLAWDNMDALGLPNPQALHESLPVTAGTKNIVTKWFREFDWI
jgi:prolyl 4-hydroxylase